VLVSTLKTDRCTAALRDLENKNSPLYVFYAYVKRQRSNVGHILK